MSFSSTNLQTIHSPLTGGLRVFLHTSADPHATVEAAGYFANGKRLGMAVGDVVMSVATSSAVTWHTVTASTGAVAVSSTYGSSAFNQAFNCTVSAAST